MQARKVWVWPSFLGNRYLCNVDPTSALAFRHAISLPLFFFSLSFLLIFARRLFCSATWTIDHTFRRQCFIYRCIISLRNFTNYLYSSLFHSLFREKLFWDENDEYPGCKFIKYLNCQFASLEPRTKVFNFPRRGELVKESLERRQDISLGYN